MMPHGTKEKERAGKRLAPAHVSQSLAGKPPFFEKGMHWDGERAWFYEADSDDEPLTMNLKESKSALSVLDDVKEQRLGPNPLRHQYTGRSLAVFTSGGDSQGMNSAVRAVVRGGLYLGCKVFFIEEGYQGMVDGGGMIKEADWNSVSDIIQKGGTIIGSARCAEFRERKGRLTAAQNLIRHGIDHLVCIGGDGSLTGADLFRQEWPSLIDELLKEGRITEEQHKAHRAIRIVGLVGSIDNDFCGTDMTIGTDSALTRIIEAVDAVAATAQSHQRSFVIEVMGRHCGYLALVSALASEADFCFIPEYPPPVDWPDILCDKLQRSRKEGRRLNIIIVAEGATDREGKSIPAEQVRKVIKDKLNFDVRTTVLGHVQRGGRPSVFDRLLGCRMGAEAVMALLERPADAPPVVVSIDGNMIVRYPLMTCVQLTREVQDALEKHDWTRALELRGPHFQRNLETYRMLTKAKSDHLDVEGQHSSMAIINVGAPCGGMNAVTHAFVRVAHYHQIHVYGVHNSFDGFADGEIKRLTWKSVADWVSQGGSLLGTQKLLPTKQLAKIAIQLEKFKIKAMLLVGGFEAFHSAEIFRKSRPDYPAFRIPIAVVPGTISNNVPGTTISLGSDTALNEICTMIDKIKQSATGTKKRVFVIETMGGYCGYLATLSGLASGADNAYIFEEKFGVQDIVDDVRVITRKMKKGVQRYMVLRCEGASKNYTTEFVRELFCEEGNGAFSVRTNILGHAQQGGAPTAFDRNLGIKFGVYALRRLKEFVDAGNPTQSGDDVFLIGLTGRKMEDTPISKLAKSTDFEHRLPNSPTDQWWFRLRPLMKILSKHDAIYTAEAEECEVHRRFSTDAE